MAARTKISLVWQNFDEEETDNKVVVQLCQQKLTYNHSTGAMRNHIQLRGLYLPLKPPDAVMPTGQIR